MKAVALGTYGGPEVLHITEFPEPHAGPGDVRIRVHAAGALGDLGAELDGREA